MCLGWEMSLFVPVVPFWSHFVAVFFWEIILVPFGSYF